jgi:hypothetical protein
VSAQCFRLDTGSIRDGHRAVNGSRVKWLAADAGWGHDAGQEPVGVVIGGPDPD